MIRSCRSISSWSIEPLASNHVFARTACWSEVSYASPTRPIKCVEDNPTQEIPWAVVNQQVIHSVHHIPLKFGVCCCWITYINPWIEDDAAHARHRLAPSTAPRSHVWKYAWRNPQHLVNCTRSRDAVIRFMTFAIAQSSSFRASGRVNRKPQDDLLKGP